MKIEKISDNQVKFILSQSDLQERDIRLSELAYGSKKTQELFREMMEAAMEECDFYAESAPLMIEAIPVTGEGIMIIVTKVSSPEEFESKLNIFPRTKETSTEKKHDEQRQAVKNDVKITIFSFKNLDIVSDACARLCGVFSGDSILYKYSGTYFLILENSLAISNIGIVESILSEYGQKYVSTDISKHYIIEHGEPIVKNFAVVKLAGL